MAGYTRTDTTNNIADGNIINATDLDNEFDGIQSAFNSSTGHNHDGTTGEGAPILVLGPTQDVVVGASAVTPKTTNTVDIGSSSLKFKDLWLAGNANIAGTTTLGGALTYGGVTLSNAVTGTGNMVLSASPTLTGTISGANASLSGTLAVTGVATLTAQPILSSLTASRAVFTDGSKGLVSNAITGTGNVVMSASPTLTGTISAEALTLSGAVTASGGTANGVAYLNGSKVLTTGSALTFDGTTLSSAAFATSKGVIQNDLPIGTGFNVVGNTTTYIGTSTNTVLSFVQNGAEQMRLTSTGLGIGTSSPQTPLHVYGTNGITIGVSDPSWQTAAIRAIDEGSSYKGSLAFYTHPSSVSLSSPTERMRLDSSGNLGIGTSSPGSKLDVKGTSGSTQGFIGSSANGLAFNSFDSGSFYATLASTNSTDFGFGTQQSIPLFFMTGNAERMRIDSSGNVGIGTSSPGAPLSIAKNGTGAYTEATWSNSNSTASLAIGVGGSLVGVAAIQNNAYLYNTGNSAMVFGTNNTERMRLDSSGNLGLGVTPSAWSSITALEIKNSIGTASIGGGFGSLYLMNNAIYDGAFKYKANGKAARLQFDENEFKFYTAPSGTAGDAISFTQAMTLTAGGNLGVGTTSPAYPLEIQRGSGVSAYASFIGNGSPSNGLLVGQDAAGLSRMFVLGANPLTFWTNSTERARIDSSGNLLVGTTSTSVTTGGMFIQPGAGGETYYAIGHNTGTSSGAFFAGYYYAGSNIGSITQSGTTAVLYNVTSDQRLKENIVDAPEFGSVIDSIKVRSYDWKTDQTHQRAGFIAQELVTVAPEAVYQPADPEAMMAVDYSKLVPMLVKEIQSLRQRLAALEAA